MAASSRGARAPQLSARQRAAISKRLQALAAPIATAASAEMEQRHAWFEALDAEHRSWVGVVARAGIDGFITWFSDPDLPSSGLEVFSTAPRALARQISLHQTVELVRTTIEVVEDKLQEMLPRGDRPIAQLAIVNYSREIAFAAAEVYARAAESRGAWDARLEALVVDAVVRGETDETVLSRSSTLGWKATSAVCVVVGAAPQSDDPHIGEELRRRAQRRGVDLLSAIQGDRLVLVLGGTSAITGSTTRALTGELETSGALSLVQELGDFFAPGPVVIGPPVEHLADAANSARAALSGLRAAVAWPQAPRPVAADDLLPERALAGDGHARRALAREVYGPLAAAGGGLMETLVAFLDAGTSIEAASRGLFVHANTVRYRLKRIHDVTGFNPAEARDAYVLRMALTLGRLLPGTQH